MSTAPAPATPEAPPAAKASSPNRLHHVVTQGLKAAGLTVGGVAAGAVLESRTQLARKLPISRPSTRRQAIRKAIAKRLP
jgi:DNA-binding FadR family transcriptional regulator